jgi:hypothetical protein
VKFGKPCAPLLEQRQSFFTQNEARLGEARRWAEVYAAQPRRTACKNCEAALGPRLFTKLGVDYHQCPACGHLNGAHEDTPQFCGALYTEDGGAAYGRNYVSDNRPAFEKRRDDIYVPKARFMVDALAHCGEDPASLAYADFGAGSGYYVAAMKQLGLSASGFEVSESQVCLGNAMLEEESLTLHGPDESAMLAGKTKAQVASLIGVLEHLREPRAMLDALGKNENVRYVFFSVPLFSLCVFIEMGFPEVMPRQLTGGHTHLYTESSIDHFCAEFGFERVGEWWFGTDMVDLFRSLIVSLEGVQSLAPAAPSLKSFMQPAIDAMQLGLDEKKLASEVHMLLRKK